MFYGSCPCHGYVICAVPRSQTLNLVLRLLPSPPLLHGTTFQLIFVILGSALWLSDIDFRLICLIHLVIYTHNPLRPTAIQKPLEIIGRVRLYPSRSFATALDSDINQTTGSGGHLSMWENRCVHAAVCLLRAGQPRSAGDAVKLGQFIGQFSWVTGDPIGLKGLYSE